MIQANELRIGNWVNYIDINGLNPAQIQIEDFINLKEDGEKDFAFFPIPLTPEILEKCGLKRHSYEMSGCEVWYLQDTSWRVARSYRDENEYKLWHERISPPTWNLKTLKYLHELQNIIFALTGEELNYTP